MIQNYMMLFVAFANMCGATQFFLMGSWKLGTVFFLYGIASGVVATMK